MSHSIKPMVGFGPIRFGDAPSAVYATFGTQLSWNQDWMDGNMNDSLFYHDVAFYFDKCDNEKPLTNAHLIRCEFYLKDDALLFDRPMTNWARTDMIKQLTDEHLYFRFFKDGSISVPALQLEIGFNEKEQCEGVLVDGPGFDTWWK